MLPCRGNLRQAIKNLAKNQGDVKRLEGSLSGYHRLRVTHYRVIYAEKFERGTRFIDCVFARERAVVYDLFEQLRLEEFGL